MTISLTDWATQFVQALGYAPTPTNVAQVSAWARAESGGVGTYNNPLNTTLHEPGSYDVNYNGGYPVQGYPTTQEGIQADVSALQGNFRNYSAIRADLQSGTASNAQFASDVGGSPWGTSGSLIGSILGSTPTVTPSATLTNQPVNPIIGLSPIGGVATIAGGAVGSAASSAANAVTSGIASAAVSIFAPLKTPFEHMAVRVALVAFGAIAILIGVATMMKDDGSGVAATAQQVATPVTGSAPASAPAKDEAAEAAVA